MLDKSKCKEEYTLSRIGSVSFKCIARTITIHKDYTTILVIYLNVASTYCKVRKGVGKSNDQRITSASATHSSVVVAIACGPASACATTAAIQGKDFSGGYDEEDEGQEE